ncbi:hypothetical protein NUW58_g6262 [Xylaria curta]|uniref:Uncharacterized protein n=1 Tax=Xylaria curta TaxID=42375 RepID=A0ACC1NWX8_9PEZI|nr:hypothetical protein NUW58_g6262 [Xylaria curta]
MLLLTDLPPEIIHHILGYVDPQDLARVPRACKRLYHAVSANTTLFKHLYLNHLDAPSDDAFNWEQALKDFVRLRALCSRDHVDDKVRAEAAGADTDASTNIGTDADPRRQKDELDFVYRAVTELLKSAATDGERPGLAAKLPQSRNADILSEIFSTESNRSAFLCRSFIYERARAGFHSKEIGYWHGPPGSEHQKGAHLHCLYGVPRLFAYPSMRPPTRKHSMRPYASSKVYDLRQYTQENKWGPFLDDGTMNVDWEKVEAIMIVLGANIDDLGLSRKKLCEAFCSVPFAGTWPNSWKSPPIPSTPRELDPVEHLDPYGITGVWLRVVCFLDYSDFFAFNFGNVELPRYISRPSISARQATRIIRMHIIVTDIEDPGPEDGQDLPVVNFKGISTAIDQSVDENANSDLRGTVLVRGAEGTLPTPILLLSRERAIDLSRTGC